MVEIGFSAGCLGIICHRLRRRAVLTRETPHRRRFRSGRRCRAGSRLAPGDRPSAGRRRGPGATPQNSPARVLRADRDIGRARCDSRIEPVRCATIPGGLSGKLAHLYNFGYCKMDKVSPTECKRKRIDKYNDCGFIIILENSYFKKEVRPIFYGVAQLLNIDLIPILRKYVDEKKDNNPDKYYYPLKD